MACLHRIYVWMNLYTFGDSDQTPPEIRDELAALSLMLAVADSWVRWFVSAIICASDVTQTTWIGVMAVISREMAEALHRCCEMRGRTSQLTRRAWVWLIISNQLNVGRPMARIFNGNSYEYYNQNYSPNII